MPSPAPQPMIALVAVGLVAVGLVAVGLVAVGLATTALAAPPATDARRPAAGLTLGGQDADAATARAPTLATRIAVDVTGPFAHVTVSQRFRNPGDGWAEGVYVFPLPEDAAVEEMRFRIDDRVVVGRIQERETAARTYDQAKASGRRAGLVSQERANVFTASVANIPPQAEIGIDIGFYQTVRFVDGRFRLRLPLVVGPRYTPGTREVAGEGGTGWGVNTDAVPDAERITPPVRHPADGLIDPVAIEVTLHPGMALAAVESPSHPLSIEGGDDGRYAIALAVNGVPADRDFVLEWTPEAGAFPTATLFAETVGDQRYVLALVMPPAAGDTAPRARALSFVVDTSGSMSGDSIAQAKAALGGGLDLLRHGDAFDVIRFASDFEALFGTPQPATERSLARARRFVGGFTAEGGTELLPALEAALRTPAGDAASLRQIVVMTDGAVGNEAALFRTIRQHLGAARLFTVGIGSAPNGHFMQGAARHGRGSYTHIGRIEDVGREMTALFERLSRAAVTDIAAGVPDTQVVELAPSRLPDAYFGEPLWFALRLPAGSGADRLDLSGRIGATVWERALDLAAAQPGTGVAKLWARTRIAELMDRQAEGVETAEIRAAVLPIALEHGLLSRFTSLVAVEETATRPIDEAMAMHAMETNLPAGWQHEAVFGQRSLARLAPAVVPGSGSHQRMFGPQTATAAPLHLVLGAAAVLLALLMLLALRLRTIRQRAIGRGIRQGIGRARA